MRFLFDFVSCCGTSDYENPNNAGRRKIQSEEETQGLASQPTNVARAVESTEITPGSGRSRTRKRSRAAGSGTGENWKPSLAAIAEDNAAAAEEKQKWREKEKAIKRKGSVRSRGGSGDSSYWRSSNELGGVLPGFSAALFMI